MAPLPLITLGFHDSRGTATEVGAAAVLILGDAAAIWYGTKH